MMRCRHLFAAAAIAGAAAVSTPSLAADGDGNFAVKGAGLESCQTYLKAREKQANTYVLMRSWLNGFVTAANYKTEETFDLAPMHGIGQLAGMLARVCRENPKQSLVQAAVGLVKGLEPARATAKSATLKLSHDGTTVRVPRNLLVRGQKKLKQMGHYDGPIDGKYGPGTRSALISYQKANDLQQTGLPDRRTMVHLLNAQG